MKPSEKISIPEKLMASEKPINILVDLNYPAASEAKTNISDFPTRQAYRQALIKVRDEEIGRYF